MSFSRHCHTDISSVSIYSDSLKKDFQVSHLKQRHFCCEMNPQTQTSVSNTDFTSVVKVTTLIAGAEEVLNWITQSKTRLSQDTFKTHTSFHHVLSFKLE